MIKKTNAILSEMEVTPHDIQTIYIASTAFTAFTAYTAFTEVYMLKHIAKRFGRQQTMGFGSLGD